MIVHEISSLEERLLQPIWVQTYISNILKGYLMGVFINGDIEVLFDGDDEITTLSSKTHIIYLS